MRVAVYGGSFNPPHVGHALVASWVVWTELADEVWLMPTFSHAFGKDMAPWDRRIAMCEALAHTLGSAVRVEPVESTLPVPSYTIDTLDALSQRNPDHDFRLLVGSDTLDDTDDWKDWDRIEAEYTPIVAGRAGYREVEGAPMFPGISSTAVRARLARGQPVGQLVPAAVLALSGGLYSKIAGP